MHENYQTSHPGGETGASFAEAAEPVDAREKNPYRAAAMAYAGDGHESAARELLKEADKYQENGQPEKAALARADAKEQLEEADIAERYAADEYNAREEAKRQIEVLRAIAQAWDAQSDDNHEPTSAAFWFYVDIAEKNLSQIGQVAFPPAQNSDYWLSNVWPGAKDSLAGKNPLELAFSELQRIGAIGPQDGDSLQDLESGHNNQIEDNPGGQDYRNNMRQKNS